MGGFIITCNDCGQFCEVDKNLTTGLFKGASSINIDYDVEMHQDDLTFVCEVVCGRCGNTIKFEL